MPVASGATVGPTVGGGAVGSMSVAVACAGAEGDGVELGAQPLRPSGAKMAIASAMAASLRDPE